MSSIRDQVIIERIKKIKERTDMYGGPTPFQDLRIVDKYKLVIERNGLLEEFKELFDEIDRHGSMKSSFDKDYRDSRINSISKGSTPLRDTKPSSETKASRPPRVTILSDEFTAKKPTRATKPSSESKATRPPRVTILSSVPSVRNTFNSHTKYLTSHTTYVASHIRRNKNGTISIVRGHARRT